MEKFRPVDEYPYVDGLDTYSYEELLSLRDWLMSNMPHPTIEDEYELHCFLFDGKKYWGHDNNPAILGIPYKTGIKDGVYIRTCLNLPFEKIPLHLNYEYPLVGYVLHWRLKVGH